jgi:hypothetical protein
MRSRVLRCQSQGQKSKHSLGPKTVSWPRCWRRAGTRFRPGDGGCAGCQRSSEPQDEVQLLGRVLKRRVEIGAMIQTLLAALRALIRRTPSEDTAMPRRSPSTAPGNARSPGSTAGEGTLGRHCSSRSEPPNHPPEQRSQYRRAIQCQKLRIQPKRSVFRCTGSSELGATNAVTMPRIMIGSSTMR